MAEPKRLFGFLGWIEVNDLRPEKSYKGKSFLNLDQFARIHFPDDQPGVATLYYPDGNSESLEDENHARLLRAIEDSIYDGGEPDND